jgi:hypothetical protein
MAYFPAPGLAQGSIAGGFGDRILFGVLAYAHVVSEDLVGAGSNAKTDGIADHRISGRGRRPASRRDTRGGRNEVAAPKCRRCD